MIHIRQLFPALPASAAFPAFPAFLATSLAGSAFLFLFLFLFLFADAAPAADPPAVEWARIYGGSGTDRVETAAATPDGGAVLAVSSSSPDGDFGPALGGDDVWIVRIAPDGEMLWKTALAGSGYDYVGWVAPAPDGGFLAVGNSESKDGSFAFPRGKYGSDDWAAKLDASGAVQWIKFADSLKTPYINVRAAPLTDGGMLVASAWAEGGNARIPGCEVGGIRVWTISAGGEDGDSFCAPLDLRGPFSFARAPGGILAAAYPASGGGNFPPRIAAFTPEGELLWDVPAAQASGTPVSLAPVPGGGFVGASGLDDGRSWLVGTGADGRGAWSAESPGGHVSAIVPSGGGFLAVGVIREDGDFNLQAFRTDAAGSVLWTTVLGGSGVDEGTAAAELADGGLLAAGYTTSGDGDLENLKPAGRPGGGLSAWVVKFRP
ncbi:MAG: PQQ-binding-like beta-propeller repeat protein [Deltaproteobacteria bacterium]|jgi:hypothetical protein|nr:PQQ-binding-like beta-propeller repeat protein [Deltaproteobacteria bacterium]